jgi:hypothetical protein
MTPHSYESAKEGKYVGYLTSIEGSRIIFSDDIDYIKDHWCFGKEIFETAGLTEDQLKEIIHPPVERGVVYNYFKSNLKSVFTDGTLMIP